MYTDATWDFEYKMCLQRSQFHSRIKQCWCDEASHFSRMPASIKSEDLKLQRSSLSFAPDSLNRERKNQCIITLWVLYFLMYILFQDFLSFSLKRPRQSCGTLGCDSWPQSHLPNSSRTLPLPCVHVRFLLLLILDPFKHRPPLPSPVPQQHSCVVHFSIQTPSFYEVSSAGLHLSRPKRNHHSPNTFALSWTDKVRTFGGQHLWLVWFLFTLSALGFFSSAGNFFFFMSFTTPATKQACIYSMCVC